MAKSKDNKNELAIDKKDTTTTKGKKTMWEKLILPNKDKIIQLYSNGAGDYEVWTYLGMSKAAYYNSKKAHPEMEQWINEARCKIVGQLKSTLFKKAMGFTYEETITEERQDVDENGKPIGKKYKYTRTLYHYSPPDTNAIYGCLKIYDQDNIKYDNQTQALAIKREDLELKKKLLLPDGEADKDLVKKLESFKIEIVDVSKKDGKNDRGN